MNNNKIVKFVPMMSLLLSTSFVLLACGGGNGQAGDTQAYVDDSMLRQRIVANGLSGDPTSGRELPKISDPLAQLGMQLFFSKSLGGQLDSACVSCHHPFLAGGDGLALPVGVDAVDPDFIGPGREHASTGFDYDGGPPVPRNSPSTFNIGLYDKTVFHDGRIEIVGAATGNNGEGNAIRTPDVWPKTADSKTINLVQAQAFFPTTSEEEMRAKFLVQEGDTSNNREKTAMRNEEVRSALAARIVYQEIPNTWLAEFQRAFASEADAASLITYSNIALALSEYQRSQVFVDNPWNAYIAGDQNAISEAAKRGALLFYGDVDDGGAGCSSCHAGDFFTDEDFHVLAIPQIGRGKRNGPTGDDDFGRFRETWIEKDKYAFRTPSLLNVEMTAPYGHSGAYLNLRDVVVHHLDPRAAVESYDFELSAIAENIQTGIVTDNAEQNTLLALAQFESLQDEGGAALKVLDLSDREIDDLVSFLNALTDPCIKNRVCLSPWVPGDNDIDPDGLRLYPSNTF